MGRLPGRSGSSVANLMGHGQLRLWLPPISAGIISDTRRPNNADAEPSNRRHDLGLGIGLALEAKVSGSSNFPPPKMGSIIKK